MIKFICNISEQVKSFINPEQIKAIAESNDMNFIKEAYPFNEETESFIRKKFDMPMPDESKE